jgi:hypothetical protein
VWATQQCITEEKYWAGFGIRAMPSDRFKESMFAKHGALIIVNCEF